MGLRHNPELTRPFKNSLVCVDISWYDITAFKV